MVIYLTTKFDISTLSFRIHPIEWNVEMLGEKDRSYTDKLPGHTVEDGNDVWTVEISIDNGRIRNWPHGIDAEVSLYDKEGVYLLEDKDGNSITYMGEPPECLRILDDRDLSFRVNQTGFIEDWKISIDLLKEWGSRVTLTETK